MTFREIQIHIDTVVLDGFSALDQEHVRAVLRHELSRAFDRPARASAPDGWPVEVAGASGFEQLPGVEAESIGRRVARAVERGVSS